MRKLLNTLYILDETSYLTLDGENIVCKSDTRDPFRMPFTNIEEIYCFSYPGCSPALMGKCAEYGINLCFFDTNGRFLARVQGKTKGNIFLRKAQFELFAAPPVILMQNTVAAKLSNTVQLVRRSMLVRWKASGWTVLMVSIMHCGRDGQALRVIWWRKFGILQSALS